MWWPLQLLVAYVVGGLTFIPLVIAALLFYVWKYASTPVGDPDLFKSRKASIERTFETSEDARAPTSAGDKDETTAPTVSAWLTVRRTFDDTKDNLGAFLSAKAEADGGADDDDNDDDKADAKGSGGGASTGTSTSTSTYSARLTQAYRGFKQARQAGPKEFFFVTLKGSILSLYADEPAAGSGSGPGGSSSGPASACLAQINVADYVVSIEHRNMPGDDVTVFTGKDGEMFTKRRAIVLRLADEGKDGKDRDRKRMPVVTRGMANVDYGDEKSRETERAPWFFFSKSNIKMEDVYLALVQVSADRASADGLFRQEGMQALIDTLDHEADTIPMRWFNAMLGRVFLGVNQTFAVEDFIKMKIMRKFAKLDLPSFISVLEVREVSVGRDAPFFSRPMLKELTKEGDASFEVEVAYRPRAALDDAACRITLGATVLVPTGVKTYKVDCVLAIVVRRIEGNVLVRIKRPPSERVWWAFTRTPKVDVQVVPVVSDRKISFNYLINFIQKRIVEGLNDAVVLPNMDDIAFFNTQGFNVRGGIFAEAHRDRARRESAENKEPANKEDEQVCVDVATSKEDPASATTETLGLRKRNPTKSQTLGLIGMADSAPDLTASTESHALDRTDSAPAAIGMSPKKPSPSASLATKKWKTPSLFSVSNGPNEDVMQHAHRASLDGSRTSSGTGIIAEPEERDETPAAVTEIHIKGDNGSQTSVDTADPEPGSSTATLPSSGQSRSPARSTASLLSAVRNKDKKAIASQVNTARDSLRKWGAGFAAKRRGKQDDDDEDDEGESGPAASGSRYAPPYHAPERERTSGDYRSLADRLSAVAQTAVVGTTDAHGTTHLAPSRPERTGADPAAPAAAPSPSSRPMHRSHPSTSSLAKVALGASPPGFSISAARPTTEVEHAHAAIGAGAGRADASQRRASSASAHSAYSAQSAQSVHSAHSSAAHTPAPVLSQPAGARSMVVPRVPKRPGAVTGIGSNPGALTSDVAPATTGAAASAHAGPSKFVMPPPPPAPRSQKSLDEPRYGTAGTAGTGQATSVRPTASGDETDAPAQDPGDHGPAHGPKDMDTPVASRFMPSPDGDTGVMTSSALAGAGHVAPAADGPLAGASGLAGTSRADALETTEKSEAEKTLRRLAQKNEVALRVRDASAHAEPGRPTVDGRGGDHAASAVGTDEPMRHDARVHDDAAPGTGIEQVAKVEAALGVHGGQVHEGGDK
ncbi:hypothetical protein Q5752_002544 [Cryptotrichosporon argae]